MPVLIGLIAAVFVAAAFLFAGIGFQTMGIGTGIGLATTNADQATSSLPTLVLGVGLLVMACFFGIMARIAQSAAVDLAAALRRRDAQSAILLTDRPLSESEAEREAARLMGRV